MSKIPGGYILLARKVDMSPIKESPPHVREVWLWILRNVKWKDNGILKRGQISTSYNEIQDGLSWKIGYRKMRYEKHQIQRSIRVLTKATMVTTAKAIHGMVITVLNFNKYQTPKNYESHSESYNENTTKAIPTLLYKKEESKNIKSKKFIPPSQIDVENYFLENGYKSESAIKAFNYYDCAGWKDSNGKSVKSWKQKMRGVWFKEENELPAKTEKVYIT